jgi:hypothetical protein
MEWNEKKTIIESGKEDFISLEKQEVSKEIPIPEYPAFYVVTQKLKLQNDFSVLMVSLDELLSYSKE